MSLRLPLRRAALLLALLLSPLGRHPHAQLGDAPTPGNRAFVPVTGHVQHADGTPAAGAVVVTSLGGEAVADADGRFELALAVPAEIDAFHVTAASSRGGASSTGTVLVQHAGGAPVNAGTLILEASSGCQPSWLPTFGSYPGVHDTVYAFAVFDDGGGPALHAAVGNGVQRWDGSAWSSLGSGMNDHVRALAVHDDGTGPALYAGGEFTAVGAHAVNHVARWDGASWSTLGSGIEGGPLTSVRALASFDDGSGPSLYAGGVFPTAGGVAASHVARWDGASWSAVGGGMDAGVFALAVVDVGGGPTLVAGGAFSYAGGVFAGRIARWDGAIWTPIGAGMNGFVSALAVADLGGGPALYAGGTFTTADHAPANGIARWDGATWSPLGSGVGGDVVSGSYPWVEALTIFDDGGGPSLYAGGRFQSAGGVVANGIARWDGSTWSALGGGMIGSSGLGVFALAPFDDGAGPRLYAGGYFAVAGEIDVGNVARWDGSSWSALASGLNHVVAGLAVFDDGGGPALYAGGVFTTAGGESVNSVARWDGSTWSPLGVGVGPLGIGPYSAVYALAVFDDGSGPALYAGGDFTFAGGMEATGIARWDGSTWSSLGSGTNGAVFALTTFDDGSGPALYVGGDFLSAGGTFAFNVARWNGSTWSALGFGANNTVRALTTFDDGTGPALYAGGNFGGASGVVAQGVARWDGSNWSSLGSGTNGAVYALAVHDDGAGPALYAGGSFSSASGAAAQGVAKWDGSNWTSLGSGISYVATLATFDDGSGPALYAGGDFSSAGGVAAEGIARWDGSAWSPLGSGLSGFDFLGSAVGTLAVFDDGGGPALIAGGAFQAAADSGDSYLAKWGCASAFAPIPGCSDNPVTLSAPPGTARIGATLAIALEGGTFASGLALLFAGSDGTDAAGCGVLLSGYGELLLALAPAPFPVAQAASTGGSAAFAVAVPPDPGLVGLTVPTQAVHVGALPTDVEVSTGLAVTLSG